MAHSSQSDSVKTITDPLVAEKLAKGLLINYQPPLEKTQKNLREVCKRQSSLTAQVENERKRLADPAMAKDLTEMYTQIKTYTAKLVALKKDMQNITEKAAQIKKRALQLQADRQQEALLKETQRETQLQHEQELIAKPTTSPKSPTS